MGINRQVLARIRDCQDTTVLEGAACTNRCGHFSTCKLRRAPFLIHTLNMKVEFLKNTVINGIIVSQFQIISSQPDFYINEITGTEEEHEQNVG